MGKYADALKDAKEFDAYTDDVLSAPKQALPKAKGSRIKASGQDDERDERWLDDKVRAWLRSIGFAPFPRMNVGQALANGQGGEKVAVSHPWVGYPDITGLCPGSGRFYAIELKSPKGGTLSAKQRIWIDRINDAGGFALVANSLGSIVAAFEEAGLVPRGARGNIRQGATGNDVVARAKRKR